MPRASWSGCWRARARTGLTDDDDAPALPEHAVTTPGDLWVLGEHRVLCGDATVIADVERVLGGQLADMTFTDPPYNVDYGSSAKDKLRGNKRKILNDNLGSGFEAFLHDACANILSVTKGRCYVCMSSQSCTRFSERSRRPAASGARSSFGRSILSRSAVPTTSDNTSQSCMAGRMVTSTTGAGRGTRATSGSIDKPVRNDLHPTMKPVALVERAISNSSKSRDIVLDPFGGSGSTLIACEKVGRQARLIELDPRYCDVIVRRWQEFSGDKAALDGDGRSFEEIAASREAA